MIKIITPATTANMGPGFDCIGMALKLYNTLWVEESEKDLEIEILRRQPLSIPEDETNLIYKTIKGFYEKVGQSLPGIHMMQEDEIPLTRGLGSSAACVVSGLLAANALSGANLSKEELLQMAARMEGHPDNAAPALLGGVVVGAMKDGRLSYSRLETPHLSRLSFAVLVPEFPLSTEEARRVLPLMYSREDAVFNASRAALLVAALMQGQFDLLECAADDRIHQPYRGKIIPGMSEVFESCMNAGAKAVFLSGAGPTAIAITASKDFSPKLPNGWELNFLEPDLTGASVYFN
ncbi:MAG: homoserine kinase [Clostridiales bacterium]|jgi:homoserine kinase|nr:homoserine kinase [Clostridiales bacterium]